MTKAGIHLANGPQDIARVVSLGCGHHLALEMQAEYLAQCPGERYIRLWNRPGDDPIDIADSIRDYLGITRHFIIWNEANIETDLSYQQTADCFTRARQIIGGDVILHWPALSPSRGYRERAADWLPAARLADIVDVHAYGSAAQILEILDWHHSQLPDKEILLTECNPGAGNGFDQAWWATEYLTLLAEADKRPWLRACIGFIWQWHNPDMTLPTTVDWIDQPIEAAVRNRPKEESAVSIAVAILPSNQDCNTGTIPGYSEMGGMMGQLGPRVQTALRQRGVNAYMFETKPESKDAVPLQNLHAQCRAAKKWLDGVPEPVKLALSLHTNAVGKDKTPFSHTAYLWETDEARRLGEAVAKRVQAALGTKQLISIKSDRYVYQVDLEPFVSGLLEVCAHDYRPDLDALYAKVDAVAEAIADGILDYVGRPDVVDYRAECERMRAELAAATARTAEANKRLSEQASIAKAAISMLEKIKG